MKGDNEIMAMRPGATLPLISPTATGELPLHVVGVLDDEYTGINQRNREASQAGV